MIVAQLAIDCSMSSCVECFEMIVVQVAIERSMYTYVGGFEVIDAPLCIYLCGRF